MIVVFDISAMNYREKGEFLQWFNKETTKIRSVPLTADTKGAFSAVICRHLMK